MASGTFRPRPAGIRQFRRELAFGALNAAYAIEGAAKKLTPVHGNPDAGGEFSTFAPGAKPIGGTLRRSIHSAVYLDGDRIGVGSGRKRDGNDENGRPVPEQRSGPGIRAVVGTNVDYAVYVHDGTVKMAARPFLARAFLETKDEIPALIAAGANLNRARSNR